MPKNLIPERKYIINSRVEMWDGKYVKKIVRWWWTEKVNRMPEGEVLKTYREMLEWNRPLSWLNGGETNNGNENL